MSPKEVAPHHIKDAAKLASIIFATKQWTYHDTGVPKSDDIEDNIRMLIRELKNSDSSFISSGRISVLEDELVGYSIQLEIGSLTAEEMDTL